MFYNPNIMLSGPISSSTEMAGDLLKVIETANRAAEYFWGPSVVDSR